MQPKDSSKLRSELLRLYDEDPAGWNILLGRDKKGFLDFLISHGSDAWLLKEYQVNPYKHVGLGSKLPKGIGIGYPPNEFPFGLRPITSNQMEEITSSVDNPRAMDELARKLLSQRAVSSAEATESPGILQGPVLRTVQPMEPLSESHRELDAKLKMQLQQIVNRRFRHTLTPYL